MRTQWAIGVAVLALGSLAGACSNDYSTGSFPRLQVLAEAKPSATESSAEVSFGQALQLEVRKQVQLINPGSRTVTVDSIEWRLDESTGLRDVNPFVHIDWLGQGDETTFPKTIAPGDVVNGIIFDVVYSPPLDKPLDDFSDSVLVIRSDARTEDGSQALDEIIISFTMPQKIAAPSVSPPNYTFSNATPTKPEDLVITIFNNPDIATAPFTVTAIDLDAASSEFTITDLPSLPKVLEAPVPGQPQVSETEFTVRFQPSSDASSGSSIRVRIFTDVSSAPILIPLSTDVQLGSWTISYDNEKEFDFTNVNSKACRSAIIISDGPGPITVREPHIEPPVALQFFDFTCYRSATKPGEDDVPIDGVSKSYPQGLGVGASIRCEVCFEPPAGGTEPANGKLVIPVDSPAREEIDLELLAGTPKPKITLGPASGSIFVSSDASAGAKGERNLFIYNRGNGNLDIQSIKVEKAFPSGTASEVFSLVSPPSGVVTVAPDDLLLVPIAWDAAKFTGKQEIVKVEYFDPFTNQNQVETLQLIAEDSEGDELPVADPGQASDYAGAEVGTPVLLDGSGSTPGALSFHISEGPYLWNLVAKPAGSQVVVNVFGGPTTSFEPDFAGTYRFELVVFSNDDAQSQYLYSEPAQVQVDVAP